MNDLSWRRDFAAQLVLERAQAAKLDGARHLHATEKQTTPAFERARWLGVQLRSLVALVAVVEEGSFVAAARRLGYSRSTISHQIAQLEAAIGIALVERGSGSRVATVTPAGRVVVAHGKAVLKLLESAEARVALLRDDVRAPAHRRFIAALAPSTE